MPKTHSIALSACVDACLVTLRTKTSIEHWETSKTIAPLIDMLQSAALAVREGIWQLDQANRGTEVDKAFPDFRRNASKLGHQTSEAKTRVSMKNCECVASCTSGQNEAVAGSNTFIDDSVDSGKDRTKGSEVIGH